MMAVARSQLFPEEVVIPREVLFGNPDRMNVRLSPDGTKIGYIAPHEGVLNVWVRSLEGGDDRPVTHDAHRGIRVFFWAYDGRHLLFLQDKDGDENWHVHAADLESGDVRDLTPFDAVQAHPLAVEPERPDEMLVALNRENPQLHDVYLLNISTGACDLLVSNPGDIIGWDADWHLNVRVGTAQCEDGGTEVRTYDPASGEWQPLLYAPFGESIGAFGVLPDESGFYLSSSLGSNTSRVLSIDFGTKQQTVIAERPEVDFDGEAIIHPTNHHLQAIAFTRARREW